MTSTQQAAPSSGDATPVWRKVGDQLLARPLIVIFVLSVIVAALISPAFLSVRNIANLLQQSSIIGVISIGMTFVILAAGIDLSVGSVAALGGMIVAILCQDSVPVPFAILAAVGAGAFIGLLMGSIVALTSVPSFIITLGGLTAIRGLTLLLTDGRPVFGVPEELKFLGAGVIGGGGTTPGIPVVGIIFIIVTIIAAIYLRWTRSGRYLYATGGNAAAARLSGVPVTLTVALTFVICSSLAAFGGVLLTAWLEVGQPTASAGAELTAIAAVVLGGTSLFGGKGGVFGTFVAVILLSILSNILNLAGVSPYFQQITTGLVLIGTVLLNWAIARRAAPMA
jgi:ribose transport system permease protein